MNEASKAMRRRFIEHHTGGFKWLDLFRGSGVDVGCGPDKIPFPRALPFDKEQGDANRLHEFFPADSLSYLHASQCLEHLVDPTAALDSWITVVKPRGYLVISVPDFIIYEGGRWPSRFNPDHKSTWSMTLPASKAGSRHVHVPTFLAKFKDQVEVIRAGVVDTNYDYKKLLGDEDQTYHESRGVEAFIEFVLKRRSLRATR